MSASTSEPDPAAASDAASASARASVASAGGPIVRSPVAGLSDALFERLCWIALCVLAFLPYLWINKVTATWPARDLTMAIDRAIPFDPRWQLVYLSVYLVVFLPGIQIKQPGLFRRAIVAFLSLQALAYPVFLGMPVGIDRPDAAVDASRSFSEWMLAFNYAHDYPRNLFPSLHVANATLAALEAWRVDRPVGVLAGVLAGLIGYSTLAVKQHALVDVLAGIGLAWAVYRAVFCRGYAIDDIPTGEVRFGRGLLLILPATWLVLVGAFYASMRLGYRPW